MMGLASQLAKIESVVVISDVEGESAGAAFFCGHLGACPPGKRSSVDFGSREIMVPAASFVRVDN